MRFKPGSSVSLWRLLDHPQTHDIQSFSLHLSRLIHLEDGMKDMVKVVGKQECLEVNALT